MISLRQFFSRRRLYDDLHDEIQAHLDERVAELMARGIPRASAVAEARRAFGNVTRLEEDGRDTWALPALDSIVGDLRFAARQLRRAPTFALTAVLTIGIGIAASTTVFSWSRAVLLNPLSAVEDPLRVLALESRTASNEWTPVSWLDARDIRDHSTSFDAMAVAYPTALAIGRDAGSERRFGELVSSSFFDVLRVRPALGLFFTSNAAGDAPGAHPEVVISWDLWRGRFHADTTVLGATVPINGYPFTIIGVAPRGFRGSMPGIAVELWVPASMLGQIVPTGGWMLNDRKTRMFRVLARLAPGVSREAADADVRGIAGAIAKANPNTNQGMSATVMPLWESHYGLHDQLRAPLAVLGGASALVLLIVSANMANLLLARATGRRRELGLRIALGAPRRRLVRQLLTEASLLAFAGSALGVLGAGALAGSFRRLIPAFAVPTLISPRVDAVVIAFAALLACAVTLLAGIAPALLGSRQRITSTLVDGGRGASGGPQASRLRGLLVSVEMALAVIAVVGAGLFIESLEKTRAVSPGFAADHVAMGQVSLMLAGYDAARARSFLERVTDQLEREPGIRNVSVADYVPLSVGEGSWEDLEIEGYAPATSENMKLYRAVVTSDYFATLGIPMREGRDFTQQDDATRAPVMIVNDAFVRRFLPGRAAIGTRVRGWGRWFTIVGVAHDTKVHRLSEPARPYFYVPQAQVYRPEYGYTVLARTAGDVEQAAASLQRAMASTDPSVPVYNVMPLAEYIGGPLVVQRAAVRLLGILAAIAVLLAAIGLYGVVSYSVTQRTREIGIRLAMGAQPPDVLRIIAGQAVRLMVLGLSVGVASAAVFARIVSSMLFGVSPADAPVYAAATAGMVVIAAAAVAVPALRALRVDPAITLREE